MADILSPTGIEKPLGGELHSRAQYLRNLDRINQVGANLAVIGARAPKMAGWDGNTQWGPWPSNADVQAGKIDFFRVIGSVALTLDGSGYAGINMPFTFPNGYMVTSMLNGDHMAKNNINFEISTQIFTNINSRFYIRAIVADSGVPAYNGVVRLQYDVTGY